MPPKTPSEGKISTTLTSYLTNILREEHLIKARKKVITELLANKRRNSPSDGKCAKNPFMNPPSNGKCHINRLPNALLAAIFKVGHDMEEEGEGDGDDDGFRLATPLKKGPVGGGKEIVDDDDDDSEEGWINESAEYSSSDDEYFQKKGFLPFQILASHVCRRWREVALQSHTPWTTLIFVAPAKFEQLEAYIQRSEGFPLNILIDCTIPDVQDSDEEEDSDEDSEDESHESKFFSQDDLTKILDLVIPHVARWRVFEFSATFYTYIYTTLQRLAECPAAPLLKIFQLYHYEDCEAFDIFHPQELNTRFMPFHGIAPNLTHVSLWGVHVDWEVSVSYLRGLQNFELAYHANDVRPSYKTFLEITDNCPNLEILTLSLSGPALLADSDEEWGPHQLEIPSLKCLVLRYHAPHYATALMQHLYVPNVTQLELEFDEHDYSEFIVKALAKPVRGKAKSLLAQLEQMKISELPIDNKVAEVLLDQLAGLLTLNINCSKTSEQAILNKLAWQKNLFELGPSAAEGHANATTYCPLLHTIYTTGVDGATMKKFVEARRAAGVPLKKVLMCDRDKISAKQEKWLKDHLESLEFFEPSDSEEEQPIWSLIESDDEEDDEEEEEPPNLMELMGHTIDNEKEKDYEGEEDDYDKEELLRISNFVETDFYRHHEGEDHDEEEESSKLTIRKLMMRRQRRAMERRRNNRAY